MQRRFNFIERYRSARGTWATMTVVVSAALAVIGVEVRTAHVPPARFFLYLAAMVVTSTLSGSRERLRRAMSDNNCVNLLSVWGLAGALALPGLWATALEISASVLGWIVLRASYRGRIHKYLFTVSTLTLAAAGAHELRHFIPLAALAFAIIDWLPIVVIMYLARGPVRRMFQWRSHAIETGAQAIGIAVAATAGHLAMLGVASGAVLAIQAAAVRFATRDPSLIDKATGAFTREAFHSMAAAMLVPGRCATLIVIETSSRREMVNLLRTKGQPGDLIGCGPECVALLRMDLPEPFAALVTTRIRVAAAEAFISVDMGCSSTAGSGTIEELVVIASAELQLFRALRQHVDGD